MDNPKNTIVFFDDYMLREYSGIRKRLLYPRFIDALPTEKPDEIGGQMVYHEKNDTYLLYRKAIAANKDGATPFNVYTSKDLTGWKKEEPTEFLSDINVVSPFVSYDRYEKYPGIRLKCAFITKNACGQSASIATSADGIHWENHPEYSFCSYNSDTANNIFYNPIFNEYQVLLRSGFVERRVFCETSPDLKKWSKPRCLMSPTPFDEPCTEYYGLVAFPQDGYFLGYLWKYLPPTHDTPRHKMAGKADTYLVYSYDGNNWTFADTKPLIERPLPPAHGCMCIYLSGLHQPKDCEWVLSGDIRRIDHACGFKPSYPDSIRPKIALEEGFAATGIYKIRKHGFAALESLAQESEVTFKRIVLHGPELLININSACGWAKFQISDENGVISGFSYKESVVFHDQNLTDFKPVWNEKDISELYGKSIILQIKMYASLLFAVYGDFYSHTGNTPSISLGDSAAPDIKLQNLHHKE